MGKSIKSGVEKPSKPHKDFPLFPHATKRWAKKVLGKMEYFGPWDNPEAALAKWLDEKDALLAGRVPRSRVSAVGVTLRDLVNIFLTRKKSLLTTGELSPTTFTTYYRTCESLVKHFGRDRFLDDFRPDDFAAYRVNLASRLGLVALGNEIQRTRSVFKFAMDNEMVKTRISFGSGFGRPQKRALKLERNKKGPRLFTPAEIHKLLKVASVQMKAIILLGCNAGMGNSDLANLPLSAVDLKAGWVDFPRPKTGASRKFPLWLETIRALKKAIADRPTPKNDADKDLVFITKYGGRWCKAVFRADTEAGDDEGDRKHVMYNDDSIGKEFVKLFLAAKLERRARCSFYTLRHVFESIGGDSCDQVAVDYIMGHIDPSMAATYREKAPSDNRLRAVTAHVHAWLFQK